MARRRARKGESVFGKNPLDYVQVAFHRTSDEKPICLQVQSLNKNNLENGLAYKLWMSKCKLAVESGLDRF